MRVTVNLATRPFADIGPAMKRLRIAMGALALLASALGIGLHLLGSRADAIRASERVLDGSIAGVQQERQGYENLMHQPDNAAVLAQVNSLNKLIDVKAFSWTLAMEDLETVLPGGVQVTTLEPTVDKKDGHITLRMRIVGPRDKAVSLVENLEHSRRFVLPRIVGESSETTGNGTQQLEPVSASNRVNFELLADYNPAAPGERIRTVEKPKTQVHTEESHPVQPAAAKVPAQQPAQPATIRPGQRTLQRTPYGAPARPTPPTHYSGGPG